MLFICNLVSGAVILALSLFFNSWVLQVSASCLIALAFILQFFHRKNINDTDILNIAKKFSSIQETISSLQQDIDVLKSNNTISALGLDHE